MPGLSINTNIPAILARRQMGIAGKRMTRSLERLSSGLRINRATDDAAGLSIAENLRAQVVGLDRAITNAQEGISLIQTAEGALSESTNILQRIRELSVQAASGTLTSLDRLAIQNEANQLIDELDRIAETTEFNSIKLLNGNVGALVSTSDPNNLNGIVVGDAGAGGVFSITVSAQDLGRLQVQTSEVFVTIDPNGNVANATANTQLQSISRFQDFGVFGSGVDSGLCAHRSGARAAVLFLRQAPPQRERTGDDDYRFHGFQWPTALASVLKACIQRISVCYDHIRVILDWRGISLTRELHALSVSFHNVADKKPNNFSLAVYHCIHNYVQSDFPRDFLRI